jgi:UDP-glucose 4-epimerase
VLRALLGEHPADALVTIDLEPASGLGASVQHARVDLLDPAADKALLDVLRGHRVDRVVHCAIPGATPGRGDSARLGAAGTLSLLAASAAAGVQQFTMRSFAELYGARPGNASDITEDAPLRADARLSWVRSKLEAESHAAAFARRYPGMRIGVLRFAPILGHGADSLHGRMLERQLVPVPRAGNPFVQLLHPDDASDALVKAIHEGAHGAFNIVPKASIPWRTAVLLAERTALPLPAALVRAASPLLWGVSGGFVEYLQHPCVADGTRARLELGFTPRYRSRESLAVWLLGCRS